MIAGERGQVLDLNNWRARVWAPACEAAGVRATPYDGRHTFASLMIYAGVPLPEVAGALGHASATTTLKHYMHVMKDARLGPAVPMAAAVAEARAASEHSDVEIAWKPDSAPRLRLIAGGAGSR